MCSFIKGKKTLKWGKGGDPKSTWTGLRPSQYWGGPFVQEVKLCRKFFWKYINMSLAQFFHSDKLKQLEETEGMNVAYFNVRCITNYIFIWREKRFFFLCHKNVYAFVMFNITMLNSYKYVSEPTVP